ncbi:hypothetical protein Tco_1249226 [Tanacetum coccineum]
MYYPSWHKIEEEKKARVLGILRHPSRPPPNIKQQDLDKQIDYWLDPINAARALQNAQNRAKSKMESSETREYPSLIQTYFDTPPVDSVFAQDEARVQYVNIVSKHAL